ncbi:protein-methionine-sulfoxide reductase heme-binding subunit MsrQ [Arenibacterium halophilum]|uniref:Protein-methionine-sulfoxide reductase heme-binding subunit MsrQ n=1 Tax=Arenibacterium halophilum TaxID=2583821 RepID=A0ABY2X635_9RHOB|nr:protein-methionine-sulfoxide reductase heme-binding subunit MsrQ [Arenibacterium halophilum]TMV10464.1 protein-methionine-sulfoxide reductase heme-binding subunit MsrQ [Arenibacterium halophilum]
MDRINSALRRVPPWLIYVVAAAWAAWMFWRGVTGDLGADPVKALEHTYGERALQLVVLGLAITPLRRFAGLNLIRFRRAIGVTTFFLVLAHFTVWAVLDVQSLARVWADIVKRPYITVGMAALALLIPLAVTSNNWSVRRLGPKWRKLHKLTYPMAVLAAVHYVWLAKGFQIEPLVYLALIVGLLALRVKWSGLLPGLARRSA